MKKLDDEKNLLVSKAVVSCETRISSTQTAVSSLKVVNTGNTDVFIRLRVSAHWEDEDNNIIGGDITLPNINYNSSDWLYDSNNNTYYYKNAVAKTVETSELLSNSISLQSSVIMGTSCHMVLEFFSEAIQSNPDTAASQSWGVTANNGTLSLS